MTAALGLTPAQLEQRKGKIGASLAPAILGMSAYKKPIDAWLEVMGRAPAEIRSPALERAARWGHRIEGPLCQDYAERHGVHVRPSETLQHPHFDWLLATPDRLVFSAAAARGKPRSGLEAKNRSWHLRDQWGPSGSDEIPDDVRAQVVTCMAVTSSALEAGIPYWDVVALVGGNDDREYRIVRDPHVEADVLGLLEEFWHRHVLADQPPDLDGSDSWDAHLQRMWPAEKQKKLVDAPEAAVELAEEIARLKVLEADTKQRKALAYQQMQQLIGDGAGFKGEGWSFRWGFRKGAPAWKAIATELGATPEVIEKHRSSGYRTPTFRHKAVAETESEE